MNSKTHKIITAFYSAPQKHFLVPIDWDIKDIKIGYGYLSYKDKEQDAPKIYEEEDWSKSPESIEQADWEDVAGYFSCCESEEEDEEDKFECFACKKMVTETEYLPSKEDEEKQQLLGNDYCLECYKNLDKD